MMGANDLDRLSMLEQEGARLVKQGQYLSAQCDRTALLEKLYQELVLSGMKFKRVDGGENKLAIIMANLGRLPEGLD